MNSAEHILFQVRKLAEVDQITRTQLVEMIEILLQPYVGKPEPKHFRNVNAKLHRILSAADPERDILGEDQ